MTRWWAYAIVTIALVCGGVTRPAVQPIAGPSQLSITATPKPVTARKGTGHVAPSAHRSLSGSLVAIVPPVIDLAPPRTWVEDTIVLVEHQFDRTAVSAAARGPPA